VEDDWWPALCERLGAPGPADRAAADQVREALRQLGTKWPQVVLSPTELAAALASKASTWPALSALRVDEVVLAQACLKGVTEAVQVLEAHYFDDVRAALRKVAPASQLADLLQQVRIQGLVGERPALQSFSGTGSLGGFLRVMATRLALNHMTRDEPPPAETLSRSVLDGLPALNDPELEAIKSRLREQFDAVFGRAFARLDVEDRNLLRLSFSEGLTIDDIAPMLNVHRATAARHLQRARGALASHVREELRGTLGTSTRSSEQLIELIRSQIEVSMGPPEAKG
jgi:RNA polymerase sigma-70 factor (ECF subfamily)